MYSIRRRHERARRPGPGLPARAWIDPSRYRTATRPASDSDTPFIRVELLRAGEPEQSRPPVVVHCHLDVGQQLRSRTGSHRSAPAARSLHEQRRFRLGEAEHAADHPGSRRHVLPGRDASEGVGVANLSCSGHRDQGIAGPPGWRKFRVSKGHTCRTSCKGPSDLHSYCIIADTGMAVKPFGSQIKPDSHAGGQAGSCAACLAAVS